MVDEGAHLDNWLRVENFEEKMVIFLSGLIIFTYYAHRKTW